MRLEDLSEMPDPVPMELISALFCGDAEVAQKLVDNGNFGPAQKTETGIAVSRDGFFAGFRWMCDMIDEQTKERAARRAAAAAGPPRKGPTATSDTATAGQIKTGAQKVDQAGGGVTPDALKPSFVMPSPEELDPFELAARIEQTVKEFRRIDLSTHELGLLLFKALRDSGRKDGGA